MIKEFDPNNIYISYDNERYRVSVKHGIHALHPVVRTEESIKDRLNAAIREDNQYLGEQALEDMFRRVCNDLGYEVCEYILHFDTASREICGRATVSDRSGAKYNIYFA